ncbi:hypothetical protein HH310_22060 [Actinoplanes sp. TBRC 11911]|uniref:SGNH hydrolase domain-containing protein n=1 Tax=Actinoplanes sp. TBRC 11911 TaxID=2729386 RepID=UPI00145D4210|nr:SGNH hydrolase domain-containing protein [Actinoplanes sp. TBRC 11911]NMO53855.1 hypothetical protein [Actinoplanes sp. TBRC 11911]
MNRALPAVVLALLAGCAEGPPHVVPVETPLSSAQVVAAVRRASAIRVLPPGLTPPLSTAASDVGFDSDRCEAGPADSRIEPCVFGDRASAVQVVLYGDSYAGMWLPAMRAIAERRHWRLRFYGKPGCPAVGLPVRPSRACDAFRAYVIGQIRASRPRLVVIANGTPVRRLADTLSRVVVLGGVPVLRESAPECLARHADNVPACATSPRAATDHSGPGYISALPWLCDTVCPPVIDNVTVYRNRFSLTATYARRLSGALDAALSADFADLG